jgi:type IV pilus assembly protein PilM
VQTGIATDKIGRGAHEGGNVPVGLLKRQGRIGIDVGAASIKLVQHHRDGRATALKEMLPVNAPQGGDDYHETVRRLLIEARREGLFAGHEVVTSVPDEVMRYKSMRLPPMPEEELKPAVQWEVQQRLQGEGESLTVDFLDAGDVVQGEERRRELVVMAAETGFVESHLEAVKSAGFEPVAIEASPVALARCLGGAEPADPTAQVVVDVGHCRTRVLIMRRGEVQFFKPIDIAGRQFTERIVQHLEVTEQEARELRARQPYPLESTSGYEHEGAMQRVQHRVYDTLRPVIEELARELDLCLRYYSVTFRGHRPEQLALVGGEAHQPWVAPMLADVARMAVTTVEPLDESASGTDGPDRPASRPEWAEAAGLAWRGQANYTNRQDAA